MYPVEAVHLLNRMGMELSNQGHHQAALVVLARALRKTLSLRVRNHEAIVRNNIALVLSLHGKQDQARRQLAQALALMALCPESRDPLYRILWNNFARMKACGSGSATAS